MLPIGTNAKYANGHLIYLRENVLVAQPFDTRQLALTGSPTPITEQVELIGSRSAAFSVSANGVLMYQPASVAGTQLVWFDRDGRQIGIVGEPGNYGDLALSPDGRRAAVSMLSQATNTRDIWIVDLERGVRTRFTFSGVSDEVSPIWSPDGSRIIFASTRAGHFDLYQKSTSGDGAEELVYADNQEKYPHAWSPDGSAILFSTYEGLGSLHLLPLDEDGREPVRLAAQVSDARVSPDGEWILFDSSESGRVESYVAPLSGGGKTQVSSEGGSASRWGRGGREILYMRDNMLMTVPVEPLDGDIRMGPARPFLQVRPGGPRSFYDVSPDGERILLNTLRSEASSSITLVQNWHAALAP